MIDDLMADDIRNTAATPLPACPSPLAPFAECPLCGGSMAAEHAHYRCTHCGWRDSCCD